MKLLLALGAGLLAFFFRAFVGDGYWDGAILLAVLLFGPIGFVSGRWSAALLGCTLLPAAFLADALYRPGAGLDSILAAPVALFLTPFAILLLLAGAGVRKLVQSRSYEKRDRMEGLGGALSGSVTRRARMGSDASGLPTPPRAG